MLRIGTYRQIPEEPPSVAPPVQGTENVPIAENPSRAWGATGTRPWVGFLTSAILHTLLFLILALLVRAVPGIATRNLQLAIDTPGDVDGSTLELKLIEEPLPPAPEESASSPEASASPDLSSLLPEMDVSLTLERNTLAVPVETPKSLISDVHAAGDAQGSLSPFTVTSVDSRKGNARAEAVAKKGGTAASEKAVEDALQWMAAHQMNDGGWSTHFDHPACMGKCRNPGSSLDGNRPAATGLALLCFLGAGYTHREGPYQSTVRNGLYYLQGIMNQDRHGGRFATPLSQFAMYEQGIAALAVCEAYQMTHDESLRDMVQLSTNYIYYAQHSAGGWGYDPNQPGDLSIACWQVMALKSAVGGEVPIRHDLFKAFDRFLDSQQSDGGSYYGYRGTRPEPGTTAMGLLMRMYRGWHRTDPRLLKGIQYLAEQGPSPADVYYNYYATQVMFQIDGKFWEDWNPRMRDYLVSTQQKVGHEMGSWYFDDGRFNRIGGRLYTTAMSCMTLEVYYRHMPIYAPSQPDDFKL